MDRVVSPELLNSILRYEPDTGKVFYRTRPLFMFTSDGAANAWNARFSGREAFSGRHGKGYCRGKIFGRWYLTHRVVWAIHYGEWPEGQIDHINHIRHDNRVDNLRVVSHSENHKNKSLASNNTSGVSGVRWHKGNRMWVSQIKVNGTYKFLGYFADINAAAAARKLAEEEFGFHKNHGK